MIPHICKKDTFKLHISYRITANSWLHRIKAHKSMTSLILKKRNPHFSLFLLLMYVLWILSTNNKNASSQSQKQSKGVAQRAKTFTPHLTHNTKQQPIYTASKSFSVPVCDQYSITIPTHSQINLPQKHSTNWRGGVREGRLRDGAFHTSSKPLRVYHTWARAGTLKKKTKSGCSINCL